MKTFLVRGTIIASEKMDDEVMKLHKKYTSRWMKAKRIIFSGFPTDYDGVLSFVRAETLEEVQQFYGNEPFHLAGIQNYKIKEFKIHYLDLEEFSNIK